MHKRIIIELINGSKMPLSKIDGIDTRADIKHIWTLYDANRVIENAPFNPLTGEKVSSLLEAILEHNQGVFLEDYVHDWNIKNQELYIYSRVIGLNKPITLLIELN